MYIHRIILRDVPGSPNRDVTLWNDWLQTPLNSVLITGQNGTGKTTTLRLIAALWAGFADVLLPQSSLLNSHRSLRTQLAKGGLAAIEIRNLLSKPLCIYIGNIERYEIKERFEINTVYVKLEISITSRPVVYSNNIDTVMFEEISDQAERLQLGVNNISSLPNMVFMDSETRQVSNSSRNKSIREQNLYPESLFNWLVTYNPNAVNFPDRGGASYNIPLEQMLRNLKVRDPKWFYRTIDDINAFLVDKNIEDFNNRLDLIVKLPSGKQHTFYELSSGERQCLLLIFMVSRWMTRGGIVLIDEPDLHLHVSLQRQLIRSIERIVLENQGQLIVTSHSPTVWEEYNKRQNIVFNFEEQYG